jgi:hypothetical protein
VTGRRGDRRDTQTLDSFPRSPERANHVALHKRGHHRGTTRSRSAHAATKLGHMAHTNGSQDVRPTSLTSLLHLDASSARPLGPHDVVPHRMTTP